MCGFIPVLVESESQCHLFEISSALFGSLFLALFADFDNDLSVGVSMGRLFPTCIVDALGVLECSLEEDRTALISGKGWTTLRGFG